MKQKKLKNKLTPLLIDVEDNEDDDDNYICPKEEMQQLFSLFDVDPVLNPWTPVNESNNNLEPLHQL